MLYPGLGWFVKLDLNTPTLSADSKSLKFPSETQAKIGPKSVTCSQIFQNRRSHCIEAIFCLRLLGVFQKSADKVGVCKSGLCIFHFVFGLANRSTCEKLPVKYQINLASPKTIYATLNKNLRFGLWNLPYLILKFNQFYQLNILSGYKAKTAIGYVLISQFLKVSLRKIILFGDPVLKVWPTHKERPLALAPRVILSYFHLLSQTSQECVNSTSKYIFIWIRVYTEGISY